MIRASLMAACLLLAGACAPPATDNTGEDPAAAAPQTREQATAQDTCGAAAYRAMIGAPLAAASFPATPDIRIIQPDTPVTMDFRAERVNVIVDADGIITALECY